jgi:proteic killer suppression protein
VLSASAKQDDHWRHNKSLDLAGYRLHLLKGADKGRWSIWVNGNWRLTFVFRDGHVFDLDFEDYH